MIINAVWGLVVSIVEAFAGAIPGFGKQAKAAIEKYRQGLETGGDKAAKTAQKTADNVGKNLKVSDKSTKDFKKSMDTVTKSIDDSAKIATKSASKLSSDTGKSRALRISAQRQCLRPGCSAMLCCTDGQCWPFPHC